MEGDDPDRGSGRTPIRVRIARLPGAEDLALPGPATPGSAGLDLQASLPRELVVPPGDRVTVPTGFRIAVPDGYEGQVRPRSGLAREFVDFIVHNKAWWMTPIIVVLALMVAFILFAESSPVLPFIYTVI